MIGKVSEERMRRPYGIAALRLEKRQNGLSQNGYGKLWSLMLSRFSLFDRQLSVMVYIYQ